MKPFNAVVLLSLALVMLGITGCTLQETASVVPSAAVARLAGGIQGGQQPVSGSHVYLMQAATTGYGQNSLSLLTSGDGTDTVGTYVLSGSNGGFSLQARYTCTASTQVYVLALGGNPGLAGNVNNTALAMMAALGSCPGTGTFATTIPFITVNEVTTVAAAYALSGFMSGPTQVSTSSTTQGARGLANAFALAGVLADVSTGLANATTPTGTGTIPHGQINGLADSIAACINTDGAVSGPASATPCYTLLNASRAGSFTHPGAIPADTITALLYLNRTERYSAQTLALQGLVTPTAPFQPTTSFGANNLLISIAYPVFGTPTAGLYVQPAVDAQGNIWLPNNTDNTLYGLTPTGGTLSAAHAGEKGPFVVTINPNGGDLWISDYDFQNSDGTNPTITIYSSGGAYISTIALPGLNDGQNHDVSSASFDTSSHYWGLQAFPITAPKLVEFDAGAVQNASSPYVVGGANGLSGVSKGYVAIDSSGKMWTATNATGDHLSAVGADLTGGNGVVFSGSGSAQARGLALDASQNAYFLKGSRLWVFDSNGNAVASEVDTNFGNGNTLAIDGANTLWISATDFNTVRGVAHMDPNGNLYFQNIVGTGTGYTGISLDPSGNAWVETTRGAEEFVGIAAPTATPAYAGNHGAKP